MPEGVALDRQRRHGGRRLRKQPGAGGGRSAVERADGSPVIAGDIYTLAGTGTRAVRGGRRCRRSTPRCLRLGTLLSTARGTSPSPTPATTGSGSSPPPPALSTDRPSPPATSRRWPAPGRWGVFRAMAAPPPTPCSTSPPVLRPTPPATWPWPTRTTTGCGSCRPARDRTSASRCRPATSTRSPATGPREPGGVAVDATAAALDAPSGVAFDAAGQRAHRRLRRKPDPRGGQHRRAPSSASRWPPATSTSSPATGAFGSTGDGKSAAAPSSTPPRTWPSTRPAMWSSPSSTGTASGSSPAATGTFYGLHMRAGVIYTVAGTGAPGSGGDGGPATPATFQLPVGVAVDRFGNLVVGDYENNRMRIVGHGYRHLLRHTDGGGQRLHPGRRRHSRDRRETAGRPPTPSCPVPAGITVDPTGNVIFADSANDAVRVVAVTSGHFFGQHMVAGDIYGIAGGGTTSCPAGMGGSAPGTADGTVHAARAWPLPARRPLRLRFRQQLRAPAHDRPRGLRVRPVR